MGEFHNHLLRALAPHELAAVKPHLSRVDFRHGEIIQEPDAPIDRVHFVDQGIVSMVTVMSDGDSVETMTIGRDGVVGAPAAFAPITSFGRAVVQLEGGAQWIEAARLRGLLDDLPNLRRGLAVCADLLSAEAQQTAACNALHPLNRRLAKWLLRCHDRCDGDTTRLTQEFLGDMLGAHRTTVTQVASSLQAAGLIRYQRGRIEVLDRPGLEAASCECYAAVTGRWRGLENPEKFVE